MCDSPPTLSNSRRLSCGSSSAGTSQSASLGATANSLLSAQVSASCTSRSFRIVGVMAVSITTRAPSRIPAGKSRSSLGRFIHSFFTPRESPSLHCSAGHNLPMKPTPWSAHPSITCHVSFAVLSVSGRPRHTQHTSRVLTSCFFASRKLWLDANFRCLAYALHANSLAEFWRLLGHAHCL